MKVDNISENPSSSKNRSKLLDSNKYLEDDDIEEDLKDFTVVIKTTLFIVARVSVHHNNLTCSIIIYFMTLNTTAIALHVTIPDLKIDTFCDFS
ncbi:1077_t:CDS:2 [Funneliformis geosporum]|uniref:1077_t:CDS:1 n=1 Tax=Funneliformis geosporum TaxID=1117311 RepID=A0A9W4WW35_9GLOM|nr:1077_t:CDS:2 [Funneliformis geosporum]